MRVTWIGGWGVAPESMRPVAEKHFAQSQHVFLAPTIGSTRQDCGTDILIAWSLGAWSVLEAASDGVEFSGMVLLLAPFVAFPSESGLGGKCSATQVKFLRRWLQRQPLAALADFCKRAELPEPFVRSSNTLSPSEGERAGVRGALATDALPYALPDLLEGLDRLSEDASPALREFAARGLPRNWQAFVGDRDPLLDGATVCRSLPGCVLLSGVGHAIADLLAATQAK